MVTKDSTADIIAAFRASKEASFTEFLKVLNVSAFGYDSR